jgi:hypothetical protein
MDFTQQLRKQAFSELHINDYHPDLFGWMSPAYETEFRKALDGRDINIPITIIEVGVWKGLSCITMANILKELGFKNSTIYAVDTWLGAPEFWEKDRMEAMNFVNGWPTIFYTFTRNVKYYGHEDTIVPFPISSIQAAEVFKNRSIVADIIYIDAAHEYNAVKADITAYWSILSIGGTMIGDDHSSTWHGVIEAVDEIFGPLKRVNLCVWYAKKT